MDKTPQIDFTCKCNLIKLDTNKPHEIARCHCSICKKIHSKSPMLFAKYKLNTVNNIMDNLTPYTSSCNAKRYFCKKCHTPVCMIYNNSKNVWIYSDIFTFDISQIDQYDICTK
mgnify:CR=1 FL=1